MHEIGPEHNKEEYRKEIVAPLYERIRCGESCCVLGVGSMGKTRLLGFIMREDVQKHYLGEEQSKTTLVLRVDCNRALEKSDWGFYVLLMTVIIESSMEHPILRSKYPSLNKLRQPVVTKNSANLGWLHLELAVRMVIKQGITRICFLFDEFDEMYIELTNQALSNLRSLRDAYKNQLGYIAILRNHLGTLRDVNSNESFYELLTNQVYGLLPYNRTDANVIVSQLEERRNHKLDSMVRENLLTACDGHPGLLMSLFNIAMKQPDVFLLADYMDIISKHPFVIEECRKMWGSLLAEEQNGLLDIVNGRVVSANTMLSLEQKGVLKRNATRLYPAIRLFAYYVKHL